MTLLATTTWYRHLIVARAISADVHDEVLLRAPLSWTELWSDRIRPKTLFLVAVAPPGRRRLRLLTAKFSSILIRYNIFFPVEGRNDRPFREL